MLPEPYYRTENGVLYHGDCLEILPHLEQVDLVLTDPPYGINIANNPFRQKFTKSDWDKTTPTERVFDLILDCSKNQIIWGGNYFNLPQSQCFLVWDKQQQENFSSSMVEQAWVSQQRPAKLFKKRVVEYTKFHPTQKPESLFVWCIEFSKTTGTVLDPFLGSGTTAVACERLGRKWIGIELEEKYCQIAVDRIKKETQQLRIPGC